MSEMTIEVRQLLIKSQVGPAPAPAPHASVPARELERAKEHILAQCKAFLLEKLQQHGER